MPMDRVKLLDQVVTQYLESADFNGLPVAAAGPDDAETRNDVSDLILERRLDLVRGDIHPNPHIKAFEAESPAEQISKIAASGLGRGCLYPTPELLSEYDAGNSLSDRPFTRDLARGAAQLDFRAFDLRVLEWYRNDPRFAYQVDDVRGSIYLKSEHEDASPLAPMDELVLFRFGFAYDKQKNRAIAIFLRDLKDMNPEHQRLLFPYMLSGSLHLHPDFYRSIILGKFPERVSIYDAFLEEKKHINQMCRLMERKPLFKSMRGAYNRPPGFGILIRPTKKEFGDFALLLDQLLSDDMDRQFFKSDMRLTETLIREDGTKTNHSIGTITLLERWLAQNFRTPEPEIVEKLIRKLRAVRDARQKPAHKVEDDAFDQKFIKQQRELIMDAFFVVRTLRMIFENHPNVSGYEVQDWLRNGRIWTK